MPNTIPEFRISTFSKFVETIEECRKTFKSNELWYRGVSASNHQLIPGLFRHPRGLPIEEITKLEQSMFDEFSFRSPSFDNFARDDWDKLFLMQHYRAPTRLLDWSASPMVALFFAVSNPQKPPADSAVWIINPAAWNSGMLNDIGQEEAIFTTNDEILTSYHPRTKSKTRRSQPLAVEGIINNPRINVQKGKFVIFGYHLKSMETFASECTPWSRDIPIAKIVIDKDNIHAISHELGYFGLTYTSVFPDLEGLAVELKLKNGFHHV